MRHLVKCLTATSLVCNPTLSPADERGFLRLGQLRSRPTTLSSKNLEELLES